MKRKTAKDTMSVRIVVVGLFNYLQHFYINTEIGFIKKK